LVNSVKKSLAILCGAITWATLFAVVGAVAGRPCLGAACGAPIGAIIGYGYSKRLIGWVVVWVSLFAVIGAVVGPGCDADALVSAVGGGAIGAVVGWMSWRGVVMLVFGFAGFALGGELGEMPGAVLGMILGAASAWFAVYLDRETAARDEQKN
jgi:hypothetical protein